MTEPRYTKEAHDLLVALATCWEDNGLEAVEDKAMDDAARAFLARAEKESAEAKGGDCPAHGPGYDSGEYNGRTVARGASTGPAKQQERSAGAILEKWIGFCTEPCNTLRDDLEEVKELFHYQDLRLKSALLNVTQYSTQVRELRAERDEVNRRIEAAKAYIDQPHQRYFTPLYRILSGEKP